MTAMEGGCACGIVRYRLKSGPMVVHACHCTECQRLTGGAFAVNAVIEMERVELLAGAPEPAPVVGTSGRPQTIFRCPACKVAVWSHYPTAGDKLAFVRVGTLDRPALLPPDAHIYTSTKLPWVDLPQGVPAFAEFYRISEVWPAESLKRQARLFGGKASG